MSEQWRKPLVANGSPADPIALTPIEGTNKAVYTLVVTQPFEDTESETTMPHWMRVSDAAKLAAVSPGTISRNADQGKIKDNGKDGHERRVNSLDFLQWMLNRIGQPESDESAEAVLKKVEKHCR